MNSQEFKEARIKLGLTVSELAKIINTNERTVRRWGERGANRPPNPVAVVFVKMMLNGLKPEKYLDDKSC